MSSNPSLADVRARRAEIAKIIGPLQAEDKELAAVESVLVRLFGTVTPATVIPAPPLPFARPPVEMTIPPPPPPPLPTPPAPPEPEEEYVADVVKRLMKGNETIEELIILCMENCGEDWWTAGEMQTCLTSVKGRDVPMGSVSPTLTNMKTKGLLVRDGMNVGLASRFKTNEAAAE
jgi:hypothetical protein